MKESNAKARMFPTQYDAPYPEDGLSKREYLAGLALQGLLSNSNVGNAIIPSKISKGDANASVCSTAILFADELLKQLG